MPERSGFQPRPIYLDNNATTSLSPAALDAMVSCWQSGIANPASQHQSGQASARILAQSRDRVLERLGANTHRFPADQLLWTSGGTESNNLVLFGRCFDSAGRSTGGNIVVSGIEHPSVARTAEQLSRQGIEVRVIEAHSSGQVSSAEFCERIDRETRVASLLLAHNETGVIQPVAQVAAHCREQGVFVHTDAVQAIGKLDVNFQNLGVDALTFAPHKFHGPVGIGGLLLRSGAELNPVTFGGFQQQGLRPGTENVALAVGAAAALDWYLDNKLDFRKRLIALRNEFESAILRQIPQATIIGADSDRLPQTSCIAFPGVDGQAFVLAADMAGIACSTGSACASGSSEPSRSLRSMGLSEALVGGAIRFSFGVFNEPDEARDAANRISLIFNKLRQPSIN